MNREDIIKLADKQGLVDYFDLEGDSVGELMLCTLVRDCVAAEREACAKVADSISEDQWALYKGRPPYTGQELERASDYTQGKSDGAEVCAAAIRARGNT